MIPLENHHTITRKFFIVFNTFQLHQYNLVITFNVYAPLARQFIYIMSTRNLRTHIIHIIIQFVIVYSSK